MTIYIEYVILNNAAVDLLLLYLVSVTCGKKMKFLRITAAEVIGTAYAVAVPFISFKGDLVLKVILAAAMVAIAFRFKGVKEYLVAFVAFMGYTFALGGCVIALMNMGNFSLVNALRYPDSIVAALLSAASIAAIAAVRNIKIVFNKLKRRKKYTVEVTVTYRGKSAKCTAFVDSGNKLYYHGLTPVIVMSDDVIADLYTEEEAANFKERIEVVTVNGKCRTRLYDVDSLVTSDRNDRIITNLKAVASERPLKEYKLILHSDM